jgi:hypothetical protein
VPQVYVGTPQDPPAGAQFAVAALAGFDRVDLWPGESRTVELTVDERELSYWSTTLHEGAGGRQAAAVGRRVVARSAAGDDDRRHAARAR